MVKQLKDENAPKRPLSAYFSWSGTVRAKVTKSMPELSITEMAQELSKRWKAMSDGQKAPFEKKYKSQKETYDKKLAKYKTTKQYADFQKLKEANKLDGVRKSKFKKDENAPSRPQSAYFLFSADERQKLMDKGMNITDVAKKLGSMWGALSAGKRKPYDDKAAKAKAKYEKEVEKYQKTSKYKKYAAEKEEWQTNKTAELKKLNDKNKPKKAKKDSRSRSKSAKRSSSKSKGSKKKKAQKRSRSRSKSKKRAKGKKKSRN